MPITKEQVEGALARAGQKSPADWSRVERMQIRRLAHEQGTIAELTRRLVEAYTGQLQQGGTR